MSNNKKPTFDPKEYTFRTDLWANWEALIADVMAQTDPKQHFARCIELGYITPVK